MVRSFLVAMAVLMAAGSALAQDPVNDGIALARALVEAGETDQALKNLRKLAADHPDDRLPHWWLANILYTKAERRREAAEAIDAFLERQTRDKYALELLVAIADDAMASAEPDVARYAARRLMVYEPEKKEHLFLAARASYLMGDRGGARQACRLLIQGWPSDRDAYLLLARAQEDDGQFKDAVATYQALIEERPGYAPARLALGSILRNEIRDYDAAELAFRSALDVADEGSPDADEARMGLEAILADRDLARRLKEHRSFLFGLVIAGICAFGAAAVAVAYVSRARK